MSHIADNYSAIMLKIWQKHNGSKDLITQFDLIKNICVDNAKIYNFLCSPVVETQKKAVLFEDLLHEITIEKSLQHFLQVVIANNEFNLIPTIYKNFYNQYYNQANILDIIITTSRTLEPDEQKILKSELEKHYNKIIICNFIVDESIIAGLVLFLKNSNLMLDLSVLGIMQQLKQHIF